MPVDLPREAERARIHGAWTGRGAGCLLGKPVEKIPREGIREILSSQGRFPLDAYFTAEGLDPDVAARWPWNRRSAPTSLVENIDGMPEDDDLNFPVLALHLLESKGADFDLEDVAAVWLEMLPAGRIFTAERCAYRNLLEAVPPEQAATHRNPFREWIGALIRADVFAGPPRAIRSPPHAARTPRQDLLTYATASTARCGLRRCAPQQWSPRIWRVSSPLVMR